MAEMASSPSASARTAPQEHQAAQSVAPVITPELRNVSSSGAAEKEFDLVLESFDAAAKIRVLRAVRVGTGVSFGDAKLLVEAAPQIIKKGVSQLEAESLKVIIEEAGGKVTLNPLQVNASS